ncbi:MAG TPA: hypothetical protein VGG88_07490 [Gaiellaceae bacterium]
MKKLTLAAATAAALACAGVAVAHGIDGGAPSVASVAGTFTATSVSGGDTKTCTNAAGNAVSVTKATYSGTASGSPDLTGTAKIDARSTIDTTANVGVVTGTIKIGKTEAHFSAVYDHGSIAGSATGHSSNHAQLLANVSAGFSQTGGFTGGKVGGGTAGGSAVELSPGGCGSDKSSSHKGKSAEGTITALTTSSITVGGLTCSVPASLAAKLAGLAVGSRVEIKCALVSGVDTLVRIDKKR